MVHERVLAAHDLPSPAAGAHAPVALLAVSPTEGFIVEADVFERLATHDETEAPHRHRVEAGPLHATPEIRGVLEDVPAHRDLDRVERALIAHRHRTRDARIARHGIDEMRQPARRDDGVAVQQRDEFTGRLVESAVGVPDEAQRLLVPLDFDRESARHGGPAQNAIPHVTVAAVVEDQDSDVRIFGEGLDRLQAGPQHVPFVVHGDHDVDHGRRRPEKSDRRRCLLEIGV